MVNLEILKISENFEFFLKILEKKILTAILLLTLETSGTVILEFWSLFKTWHQRNLSGTRIVYPYPPVSCCWRGIHPRLEN